MKAKSIKILFLISIALCMICFSSNVKANTITDNYFDSISTTREIHLNSISLDNFTDSAFCEAAGFDTEIDCFNNIFDLFVRAEFVKLPSVEEGYYVSLQMIDSNTVRITMGHNNETGVFESVYEDFNLTFEENNSTLKGEALKIASTFTKNYYNIDMAYINQKINFGDNIFELLDNNYKSILNLYPEIKETIELNPEYNFIPVSFGFGGTPGFNGNVGSLFVMQDNVVYALTKPISYGTSRILLVPDTTPQTTEAYAEAALKRVKEYINDDTVNITLERETDANIIETCGVESASGMPCQYLASAVEWGLGLPLTTGDDSELYPSSYYKLTIGEDEVGVYIVAVPASQIKELEIKSISKTTGISISTTDNKIPMDTSLRVEDVTSSMNNKNIIKAFDIDLYSLINNNYIKQIAGGVKVMIPVATGTTSVNIYYIKEDGLLGEKYNTSIEVIDDKTFAVFTTKHFSTYGIVNDSVNNPNTGDNIALFLSISIIGLITIFGTIIILRKSTIRS